MRINSHSDSWMVWLVLSMLLVLQMGHNAAAATMITSHIVTVDGLKMHYLTAGQRPNRHPPARLHSNLANVETDHPTSGRQIYRDSP